MNIRVTADDIISGQRGSFTHCPIGLALSKMLGIQASVSVYGIFIYGQAWDLPKEARHFIQQFDTGERVFPIAFNIAPVAYYEASIGED